jgi:hypothetical protein
MPVQPEWTPNLQQRGNINDCIVDLYGSQIPGEYKLNYSTTYILKQIDVNRIPPSILTRYNRPTGIGIIPLLLNTSNEDPLCPIIWSSVDNSNALVFEHIVPSSVVSQQGSTNDYNVASYNNIAIIKGAYNSNGSYSKNGLPIVVKVLIDQSGNAGYEKRFVQFLFTITKTITTVGLKSRDTILSNLSILGNKWVGFPIIQYEYEDAKAILSFSQFATTDRKLLNGSGIDYSNIIYYISRSLSVVDGSEILTLKNDYIDISNNIITLLNSTYPYNVTTIDNNTAPVYFTIPIAFYQDEDAIYKQSAIIGDSQFSLLSQRTTIQLRIVRSTPFFTGQSPSTNTGNLNTVYLLPNLSKMTTSVPFEIVPPHSTNTDSSNNFIITSNTPNVIKIVNDGSKFMAYVYDSGIALITIFQKPTRNFNAKTANLSIYVNLVSPSIVNCNNNIVYTNPYQSQFWNRFKPPCHNYNLTTTIAGISRSLTPDQVDDVYSMRRKTEILKYKSSVGGLTKSQKYAKAARGELTRQIGNENKYLQNSDNSYSLICKVPTTRVLCGLTSACGVPGKEQVLCYDPSINVYNMTRTYEYRAGLQTTSNIPTLALTPPRNLVGTLVSGSNNIINLTWDSPVSNGGLPITGYIISFSNDNKKWTPYKSVFPTGMRTDPSTGEKNGNYAIFEPIPGSVTIETNQIYYISVFSANERGLSSIPLTISVKTASVPSIITDLSIYGQDRISTEIKITWTDPVVSSSSNGIGYNGPNINGYKIRYKDSSNNIWNTRYINSNDVYDVTGGSSSRNKWYSLNNLFNKLTYSIVISPMNTVGTGPESRVLAARTLMSPSAPYNIKLAGRYGIPENQNIITTGLNYITVSWSAPDNGGSIITSYNITLTLDETINQTYYIDAKYLSYSITGISNTGATNISIQDKTYNITMTAFNADFERSKESIPLSITVLSPTIIPIIREVVPYYNEMRTAIDKIKISFFLGIFNESDNPIVELKVSGLGTSRAESFVTTSLINTDGKAFLGSGLHSIYVPSNYLGNTIIIMNLSYPITLNFKYGQVSNYYLASTASQVFTTEVFTGSV